MAKFMMLRWCATVLLSSSTVWATPLRNGQLATEDTTTYDGVPLSQIPGLGGLRSSSIAEGRPALAIAAVQLDRSGWTATADSFQPGNEPGNVLDDNPDTIWHTEWSPNNRALPHRITIDMKASFLVNSVSYQPRQDGSYNGNIGQHRIELSQDNTNWGTPLAIGTYLDDPQVKTTIFKATNARYMRLTALTEAGGRGPWTSAADIKIYTTDTPAPSPQGVGEWSPTIDFPLVPVSAALERDTGKVLTWSAYAASTFTGGNGGVTLTATFDPVPQVVSQRSVDNTQHDMFCPGLSLDFTGRPVVTGGNDAATTSIYSTTAGTWTRAADMRLGRGYHSQTTLSDGRTWAIGGSWSGTEGGKNGEVYSPSANTWTLQPGCPVAPILTNDAQGVYRSDNHAWLFAWRTGSVFHAGPSRGMNWYTTSGTGGRRSAGQRASDPDAMNGNAIMYDAPAGKILAVGGAVNYQGAEASTNAHVITITSVNVNPTVSKVASMVYPRAFANGVVLPDGKVFVTGGQANPQPFSDDRAQLISELWDPATSRWTSTAPMTVPRTYHSVALLLLDGTVFVGGGGLCGECTTNHYDAQVYSPPYLFTSSGGRAPRPVINSVSSSTLKVGTTFTFTTNSAITRASLVRYGTTTHTVNTDQRRIPLTVSASGNTYTVTVPSDPGVALPGYWMLFVMNSAGTPSISRSVRITL